MSTYKALYLSPMIPSYNLEETGKFFKDILNFIPHMETETNVRHLSQRQPDGTPAEGRKRYRPNGILPGGG